MTNTDFLSVFVSENGPEVSDWPLNLPISLLKTIGGFYVSIALYGYCGGTDFGNSRSFGCTDLVLGEPALARLMSADYTNGIKKKHNENISRRI